VDRTVFWLPPGPPQAQIEALVAWAPDQDDAEP